MIILINFNLNVQIILCSVKKEPIFSDKLLLVIPGFLFFTKIGFAHVNSEYSHWNQNDTP